MVQIEEDIKKLLEMDGDDPEVEHYEADEIILKYLPIALKEAYLMAKEKSGFWYS